MKKKSFISGGPWGAKLNAEERAAWVKRIYDEMRDKDKATFRKMNEALGIRRLGVLGLVDLMISMKLHPQLREYLDNLESEN